MLSTNTAKLSCPCGSSLPYSSCCEAIHNQPKLAATAEQLMRSRYSAFTLGNTDYLLRTHHPSKRSDNEKVELEESMAHCQWTGLTVLACHQGLAGDCSGRVEFIANYLDNQQPQSLHEISQFCYEDEQWFYLDGIQPNDKLIASKLGRNEPCWCGSNKKYKKCHG